MKSYRDLVDDLTGWLEALISDIVQELTKTSFLDAGFIYSPYIPLTTTNIMIDPNTYSYPHTPTMPSVSSYPHTLSATNTLPTVNTSYYSTMSISSDGSFNPLIGSRQKFASFDAVLEGVTSFVKEHPDEVPSAFSSVEARHQKNLVRQTLKSLTSTGILNYNKEQKGWWRPEVLDAMAALEDGPTSVEDEPLTLGPCESETPSP